MADPGILAAMADQAATEGPGNEEAMAERGVLGRAMEERGARVAMEGSPPPKIFMGKAPHPRGGAQEPWKGELDRAKRREK